MNLKKLRNLVLSLVGALFLTVFLCGTNPVKAGNESPNGHKVYFLASKNVYSSGEEFAGVDFGAALTGVNANPRGLRVTAYYTDEVEYYYYVKIDGFNDEVDDVEVWIYDYTQPTGSEENYMVNNSYYEVDGASGKVVAVYHELLLGTGIESGSITFFNDVYIDDSSFDEATFEQYVFILRNESFRTSGTVIQRPDMGSGTKVQYKNSSTNKTEDYFGDGIFDELRNVVVVDKNTGAEVNGTLKVKLDDDTGEETYVIASSGSVVLSNEFDYGSGIKRVYTSNACTAIDGGNKLECDWTLSPQDVSKNFPINESGTFYYGVKYESNLGTVVVRIIKVQFFAGPSIEIGEGLELRTSGGTVVNGTYDVEGNYTYSWINQTATLTINASNIYFSDEASDIKNIDFTFNGTTTNLCKTSMGQNGCDNGEYLTPKTATIEISSSFEGINDIRFELTLGDSNKTIVVFVVTIKLDMTAPNVPSVAFNQPAREYNGKNYFTQERLVVIPTLSENGTNNVSGLASSRLSVMKHNGTKYMSMASAYTDILVQNGAEFDFSTIGGLTAGNTYKLVLTSTDKAGNSSVYEYEFCMDYGYPKFAQNASVIIDDDKSTFFVDSDTNDKYFSVVSFYLLKSNIEAGSSGIKKVEFCLIELETMNNANPGVGDCSWNTATYSTANDSYVGSSSSVEASGYYRIAYRATNNLDATIIDTNVVYNDVVDGENKFIRIDNIEDEIDFSQDTDDVWGNTKISLSFNIVNSFSPVTSVEIIDLSDDSIITPTIDNGDYNFDVFKNGYYKIVVKDLIGNESVEEFEITGIDDINPVLSSIKYDVNYIGSDIYLTEASSLLITAYDNSSGIKEISVNVYKNGTEIKIFESNKVVSCSDNSCSTMLISMSESNISENDLYEFYVKITDRAGNSIEFRRSSEDNYYIENSNGKVNLNGIPTDIDYSDDLEVTIGDNGTWEIDGVDTEIGAVYEFNYLNGSPTVTIDYAYEDGGHKYAVSSKVIYAKENLYLYVNLPDVTANMKIEYAICSNLANCVSYSDVIDNKITIDDPGLINNGKINYVKILSSYIGSTSGASENVVSFMLDNTPDVITLVSNKQASFLTSKTVDINVVSDKNGGSDRNRVLYMYSATQLEEEQYNSESDFATGTAVNSTNIMTATLNGYYYFFYEDKALNQSYGFIRITVIDNVYPTVKFNDNDWNKIYQSFSTTVSITDETVSNAGSQNSQSSGVSSFAYAWTMNPDASFAANQLTTVTSGFESVKTTTISKTASSYVVDGVYYLFIYVKDYVGNEYQGVNTSYYVVIDNTVPTTDHISTTIQFRSGTSWVNADERVLWFNTSVNIKISATEYNFALSQYVSIQSGVYGRVVYAVADSSEVDSSYTYSSHTASRFKTYIEEAGNGVVITDEGQYKVFIYAIDEANNVSGQVIVYVNIDTTAPSLKTGYTSVLSNNFSHSVEKIENNTEGVSSFSYDSIIENTDIVNYVDNIDLAGVTYHFDGIFTDAEGTIEYVSPSAPIAYTHAEKIKYTRNNFLKIAEDNQTYYIKLVLVDRAGNEYVELVDIFIATSVPPIITLIKTTLGCDDNLATTVLCHLNVGTNQHEIKLIYGDEDINGNRYITADSRINPKEILINIGIDSFTTYINAKVEDNIDRTYQITSTTYNLDLKQEGSTAYICFTATDSSGNVVGNVNACNYDTDAEFREYLIEYIYQRDKLNAKDGEEPPRLTSDEVALTEEYITADQNRIKLTVGYLNGPYLSFIPFDPKATGFDSTSSDYISNYSVTYLQKSITGIEVPGYVEPGVYFADYDNVVGVHTSFATVGDLTKKIGVQIKRYVHIDTPTEKFEDTPEFILTHWKDPAYFAEVTYSGGEILLDTPDDDAIYVIRYVDNQHVDDSSTTRNIFRKIVYTSGVPIIDQGNYLATNIIQVEKNNTDAIPIDTIVSCFVYDDTGLKNKDGCTLTWNVYDINYKLLGSSDYSIPKNKLGAYRIIFSAIDSSNRIQAPTTEIVINVVDTTAPTISFTKDSYKYMTFEYGQAFTDEHAYSGIVVTDDYDQNNINYEMSGTVDTSRLGCYTLLYSAKDSSKNVGYNQRIVCVVDTKAPTITMKDGYVNDTTMDGQDIVNAKSYQYERSSMDAFNLREFVNNVVVSVSDNRAPLTKENLLIQEIVSVDPTKCGKYVVKIILNDTANYQLEFGSDVPSSIIKSTPDNIVVEYIIVEVIDTKAPEVNVTDVNSQYIANNSIITEVNSVLRVNLFDEEQYEYGDVITIKLNGNEISSSELNTSISSNGYYHYEFIDSSGNTTTFTFILMMASYPTIRIESSSITFDITNSKLGDVKNGVANVKLNKADAANGITYEAGESIVILGYSTVSSIERYDILYSLVLTESLVSLLEIDDYEFNVSGIGINNVLVTKVNASNTVKLGIGVGGNQQVTETEETGGNSTVGIIAIIGLVVVAGGAFMLLKKKKNKN